MKPLKKFMKSAVLALSLVMAPAVVATPIVLSGASVAQAAVVNRIDVRGNTRMDAETVASYLTISPGKRFGSSDIDDSVKALFGTGLFSDVSIYQSGSTLVVEVDENGTVNRVFFEGNNRIKDEALKAAVQTSARSIYSEDRVISDVENIERAYQRVGRDGASVSYEVVPLANNRVNVIFRVNEGGKTVVRSIDFIGNVDINSRRLKDQLTTKETNFLSFIRTDDIYDPDRLAADEERLRRFYFNQGYADFQVISSSAELNEIDNEYQITFTVEEGPRYRFGEINIDSTLTGVDADSLYSAIETQPGDYYSAKKVEQTIVGITTQVAEAGFAFVEVTPRGDRNFESNTIDVTYLVDEGARVYVEAINIVGNDKTREYVIRREFDISEGDAYNQVLVNQTKRRLEATGLFERVMINARPGSAPDRIVLSVAVIEGATGEFSAGGGYSTTDGPLAEISFSEKNFLGRGQYIRVAAGIGTEENNYSFAFTEPYFLGYRVSAGFDISLQDIDADSDRQYAIESQSGTIRFGVPLSEKLSSTWYYRYKTDDVTIASSLLEPASTVDADAIQGNTAGEISSAFSPFQGDYVQSGFGANFRYMDLDNPKDPRNGFYASVTTEIYGAGGDANYGKVEGTAVAYGLVSEELDIVAFGRVRGGHIENFSGTFRTLDNFFTSSKQVRGFDTRGFGPRDPVTGDALGGMTYANATAELQFPMPFIQESAGFRAAVFADIGMIGNLDSATEARVAASAAAAAGNPDLSRITDDDFRASVGASVIWNSPFGPLRVDYAVPLNDKSYDKLREFNFGISSKF